MLPSRLIVAFGLLFIIALSGFAQENPKLVLQKTATGKEKTISPNSKFKLKTLQNKKFKGRIDTFSHEFLVSEKSDTIYFNNIQWIKAKAKITKVEKGLSIAGLFVGAFYTPLTFTASTLKFLLEDSSPAIFLLNAAPVAVTIISVRALGGRRYNMKKWHLKTQQIAEI